MNENSWSTKGDRRRKPQAVAAWTHLETRNLTGLTALNVTEKPSSQPSSYLFEWASSSNCVL